MHEPCDQARLTETLSKIKKKYVILSGKGGVGKSTVSVNLAVALALSGRKTGLLDSDLHGPSVPKMLGIENEQLAGDDTHIVPVECFNGMLKVVSIQFLLRNLNDSVVWRGPLKHSVISQFIGYTVWGDIDYLIIDSPPGTGDEPLSVIQTANPDGAIIVTTPQDVATFDVKKSINFCDKMGIKVTGIIENMSGFVCPHCHEETAIFSKGGGERMAKEVGAEFLGRIPIDPSFVTLSDKGSVFVDKGEKSATLEALNSIIAKIAS